MHLFKEICILIRLCRHTRSFSVFLAISTGLFYTIEVYPLSSERVNKLPNNPQEEKKTTSAFFLPKKELFHFRNTHGDQQNKSPDLVSPGNNDLVMH